MPIPRDSGHKRTESESAPNAGTVAAEADSPLQQFGYVRCYRAIVQSCGIAEAYLYGILEDYVQLGARTKKGAVPSHDHLAELMQCSARSITTYLNRLRDKGWVRWDSFKGKPSKYFLPNHSRFCRGGTQIFPTTSANFADNLTVKSKHLTQATPLPPAGGRDDAKTEARKRRTGIPDDWALTPELRAYAVAHGIPDALVDDFAEEYRLFWLGDGRPKANWNQAFQGRVRDKGRIWAAQHGARGVMNGQATEAELAEVIERARSLGYQGPMEDVAL